jgi:hypothetical protein
VENGNRCRVDGYIWGRYGAFAQSCGASLEFPPQKNCGGVRERQWFYREVGRELESGRCVGENEELIVEVLWDRSPLEQVFSTEYCTFPQIIRSYPQQNMDYEGLGMCF